MDKRNPIDKIDFLQKKHPDFFLNFGSLMVDMSTGDHLFYSPIDHEAFHNLLIYMATGEFKGFERKVKDCEIDFLTEKEIDELMEKSERDGVDYLYERVIEHPCKTEYPSYVEL